MAKKNLVFKVFGYNELELKKILNPLNEICKLTITTKYLDSLVSIACEENMVDRIDNYVYSTCKGNVYADSDIQLANAIVERLAFYGIKVSVAESLTGGLVGANIVNVPGASEVFMEGIVAYSNASKVRRLGVSGDVIKMLGAISKEVAKQMAIGLIKAGAGIAISTTGNAGPSASEGKPVGLVYIGVADENMVNGYEYHFEGDREEIRNMSANTALFLLWRKLVHPTDFESMVIE